MTKTTHIAKYSKLSKFTTSHNAACGRMVNYMGITKNPEEVTCKGCRKNLVNIGVLPH